MIKKYFSATVLFLAISIALVVLGALGFFPLNLFIFAAVALVWLIYSFKKPVEMFWLFVALLPLENIIISPEQIPFSLRPFQLAGVLLVIAVIARWILGKLDFKLLSFKKICLFCRLKDKKSCEKIPSEKAFNIFDRLVFLFPVFSFLALINSQNPSAALKQALVLVSFVALYWLARNFLQTQRQKLEALWFFILGSFPVIIFGLYQAIAFKFGWPDFEVMDGRINSTFTEPDWLGIYLVFLSALVLWLKNVIAKSKSTTMVANWPMQKAGSWFLNFYLFFIFLTILLTVSRSAWLGFAGVVLAYLALIISRNKGSFFKTLGKEIISLAVIFALAFSVMYFAKLSTFHFANRAASSLSGLQKITVSCTSDVALPLQIESVEDLTQYNCRHINLEEIEKEKAAGMVIKEAYRPDPNVDIRKKIYSTVWREIQSHPWLGEGLGSSLIILGTDQRGAGLNSSNIFLEVWLSMGIFALIILTILILRPFYLSLKNIFSAKDRSGTANDYSVFVLLSVVAILIPNLFNAGLFLGFFWIWLAVLAVDDRNIGKED